METDTLFVIDYIADGEYGLFEVDPVNQDSMLFESSEDIGELIALSKSTVYLSDTVREIYNGTKALIEKEDALKIFVEELVAEMIEYMNAEENNEADEDDLETED